MKIHFTIIEKNNAFNCVLLSYLLCKIILNKYEEFHAVILLIYYMRIELIQIILTITKI